MKVPRVFIYAEEGGKGGHSHDRSNSRLGVPIADAK